MTSLLEITHYDLKFFENFEKLNNIEELSKEIINKINKLSKRVGAPSYQKTPVFKRNNYRHNMSKNRKENITEEDWNTIRNFKKTKLEKNTQGIEAKMDKIRCNWTQLTKVRHMLLMLLKAHYMISLHNSKSLVQLLLNTKA